MVSLFQIISFRMINNSAALSIGLLLFIYFLTYSWLHFHSSFCTRCDAFLMCFLFWHLMFCCDRDSLHKDLSCTCLFFLPALHYHNVAEIYFFKSEFVGFRSVVPNFEVKVRLMLQLAGHTSAGTLKSHKLNASDWFTLLKIHTAKTTSPIWKNKIIIRDTATIRNIFLH